MLYYAKINNSIIHTFYIIYHKKKSWKCLTGKLKWLKKGLTAIYD